MPNYAFSIEVEKWLKSKQTKTLANLIEVFDEKSFAVLFMLLLFFPSLPIPTGGVTDFVLIPVAVLLSLELIIGRDKVWLPSKVQKRPIGKLTEQKVLPFMIKRIRWFERFARPSMQQIFRYPGFARSMGLWVLTFTLAAFFAPPFSGLDTLPSFGVVVMSLGVILEDGRIYLLGILSGLVGIGLAVAFGAAIAAAISRIF